MRMEGFAPRRKTKQGQVSAMPACKMSKEEGRWGVLVCHNGYDTSRKIHIRTSQIKMSTNRFFFLRGKKKKKRQTETQDFVFLLAPGRKDGRTALNTRSLPHPPSTLGKKIFWTMQSLIQIDTMDSPHVMVSVPRAILSDSERRVPECERNRAVQEVLVVRFW